mmetsp:Transcript_46121/g.96853  ORF Transcript_46121/g.96853 Transcript_46121/m.96853 type:complete len:270 (+) Transcript_46121:186-995(+)
MTMRSLLSMIALAATATLPINTLALSTSRIRTRSTASCASAPMPSSLVSQQRILLESTVEDTYKAPTSTGSNDSNNNLSPFLQGMVDEQRELQMNVGKAMDVLKKDYPYFLKRAPDYSIYHDDITLSASDGQIQLSKLTSYKRGLGVLRTMLGLLYDTDRSIIQNRMVYDTTRTQIRISFNAMLVPKLGGRTVHVDGISVYSIDLSSSRDAITGAKKEGAGKVREHKLETLLVNGKALQPPYFNAFGLEMVTGQHAGALAGAGAWSFET